LAVFLLNVLILINHENTHDTRSHKVLIFFKYHMLEFFQSNQSIMAQDHIF